MADQPTDTGAPIPAEVERITRAVLTALKSVGASDLTSTLTVLCNITGQVVASMADGQPSAIQAHADSVAENVKTAAIAKMFYDDEQRRKKRRAAQEEALAVEIKNGV